MAISQDPSVLVAASRCFDTCIPPGEQQPVKTYLLAQIAGVTDPTVLANNARCFSSCIPPGAQVDVQAYLSAVLEGGTLDPSALINNATCFRSCVPPGAAVAVTNYALSSELGLDPSTLANLARCFSSCIPSGMQAAAQNYLLGVIAGITDPATILTSTRCFRCFDGSDPTLGDAMLVRAVVGGFVTGGGGGGTTPETPTGFSFVLAGDHSVINVSWTAPPAGVTTTELWTSTDNITFALESSIAAPGNSTTSPIASAGVTKYGKIRFCVGTTCGSFTASQSAGPVWPLTESWQARVVTNGGAAPGAGTVAALKTFEVSIQSIVSQIVLMNVIAPDSLIAAFTPFIKPVGGNDPWTNTGYVAGDLAVNGLTNTVASPHLRTGVTQLAFAYGHIGIEVVANCLQENVYDFGCSTAAVGTEYWINADSQFYGGKTEVAEGKNFFPAGAYGNAHGGGILAFWAAERTATNLMNLYQGDSGTGFNLTGTENGAIAADARTGAVDFQFSGQNVSGASTGVSSIRRYSYISATTGLSAADTQTLFNAVKALRLGFGGGAP